MEKQGSLSQDERPERSPPKPGYPLLQNQKCEQLFRFFERTGEPDKTDLDQIHLGDFRAALPPPEGFEIVGEVNRKSGVFCGTDRFIPDQSHLRWYVVIWNWNTEPGTEEYERGHNCIKA